MSNERNHYEGCDGCSKFCVYIDTELTHKDVVILAEAVMPLIEGLQTNYKLLEALKEQLLEENEEFNKKLRRHQKLVKKIQGVE